LKENIAGSLPDSQASRPRKFFTYVKRTIRVLCSRRTDWPISARIGGFRPPGCTM